MAKLAPGSYPFPEFSGSWREQYDAQNAELNRLTAEADANNSLVGQTLKWQRADGYAIYIVTSVRPLTIQHVDIGDAWTIEPALIRGLNRADIEIMVERERSLRAYFANKKDA